MKANAIRDSVPFLPLFVPANRASRIPRAVASGADAVIVDLEDAVGEEEKASARASLFDALAQPTFDVPILVRVNAYGTPHFEDDLSAMAELGIAGIVLPKAEMGVGLESIRERLGPGRAIVAIVETARGLAQARALARSADRLAFGSIDYADAIGAAHRRETLLTARSELVLAAALAPAAAPIDGVTARFDAPEPVEDDARYAHALGFGGKLLIHPAQIAPAIRGFAPESGDIDRAREVLARVDDNATAVGGQMVDRPVIAAARRQVEAFERAQARLAALEGTRG